MTKYPKSHWPPPDPPEFVRDEWLTTFEAFNLVGRDRFPDEWMDGKELAAPSDEEIAANKQRTAEREFRAAEKRKHLEWAKRASVGVRSGRSAPRVRTARPRLPAPGYQGPPFPLDIMADESVRKEARARGDNVWEEIRQWLYAGTVPAAYLDDYGDCREVAGRNWGRPIAMPTLLTGQVKVGDALRLVLISKPHLEAAIQGEPMTDYTATREQDTPNDGVAVPIPPPAAKTSGKVTAPYSGRSKPTSKKPGRPSQKAGIEAAFKELLAEGKVNFRTKKANYPAIREKIAERAPDNLPPKGLGDEAIRTVISALFESNKAKAEDAP